MSERIFTENLFNNKTEIQDYDSEKEKVKIVQITESDKTKTYISYALVISYLVIGIIAFLLV